MTDRVSRLVRQAVRRPRRRAATTIAVILLAAMLVVAGCAGPGATALPTAALPTPGASPPASSTSAPGPVALRFALDWTPNTNHLGLFVARANGWYDEAGIDLQLLPYSGATPETLMAAGQADCGVSFQDALTFAAAAGAPIVSVMAILQHAASDIAVLASGPLERPRDLDGRVYAGFGYPNEEPTVRFVIQADGGQGEFTTVALADSAAYEALYAGRADFVISFSAWEGVEARLRGIDLRTFAFTDYGFPDFYQVVVACSRDVLEREPDAVRRFVAATVRGFEAAQDDPDEAARVLVEENPGIFDANPDLPRESARFLAEGGYFVDGTGRVGVQTLEQWSGYSGFLYEQGLLTGPDGSPLTEPPDYAALFTNDFLPPGP